MSERYRPKVAILEEMRQDLMRAARAQTRVAEESARQRWASLRARPGTRVVRRVALLGALIALIGGVALAARLNLSVGGSAVDTAPVRLATGPGWTLGGYRHEDRLCVRLATFGSEMSVECAPAHALLRVTSALAGGRRLVGGLVGPRVHSVEVRVGSRAQRVATRAAGAEDIEAAGLPVGVRWFLLELDGLAPRERRAPADVQPLGAEGGRLGGASVDCSLGATHPACLRAASGQAAAELR